MKYFVICIGSFLGLSVDLQTFHPVLWLREYDTHASYFNLV
jgi:hypothetical protein